MNGRTRGGWTGAAHRNWPAGRPGPRPWAVALALLSGLLLPAIAYAHLALLSVSPAAGETLSVAPSAIRLSFTEPIELPLSGVTLSGPAGEVLLGSLEEVEGRENVGAEILGRLMAGSYSVRWQAVGRDGHPVRGEYEFTIEEGAAGLAPLEVADTMPAGEAVTVPPPVPSFPTFDSQSPLYAAVRWLTLLGMLGIIGALGFALLLRTNDWRKHGASGEFAGRAYRGAAAFGILAALLQLVALPLRLQAQSHAIFGRGITAERFSALLSSLWGVAWVAQAAGVALALAGLFIAWRGRASGWILAALGILLLPFTPGMSGHAAAVESLTLVAIAADGVHVLAAGAWLGTLFALVVVGMPAVRSEPEAKRGQLLFQLVNAFSPPALAAAALVVATGAVGSFLHLSSPTDLWTSEYGRLLLLKLVVVGSVFAVGAYNWRRLRLRVARAGGDDRFRRSASFELAATVVVIAITAVLTAVPPPGRAPADVIETAAQFDE